MKTPNETPDNLNFNKLLSSLSVSQSRRAFFKGAAAGAAGIAAVGAGSLLLPRSAYAGGGEGAEDTVVQILSIAATAEELAVTFYSHGIANASKLGISGANLSYLQAAVIEEQIHRDFEVSAGGKPLTDTFSFPNGQATFEHLNVFIATLEKLEEAFIAAYLAAVASCDDIFVKVVFSQGSPIFGGRRWADRRADGTCRSGTTGRYCWMRVVRSPARPWRSIEYCQARNSSTVSV